MINARGWLVVFGSILLLVTIANAQNRRNAHAERVAAAQMTVNSITHELKRDRQ